MPRSHPVSPAGRSPAGSLTARRLVPLVIALVLPAAAAHAADRRTQGACSPVIESVQGSVTLTISGGCTAGITQADIEKAVEAALARRPVPPELLDRYDALRDKLGITDSALNTFFIILGENKVRTEDLDARLREIAGRHLMLLRQAAPSPDDDPEIAAIKKEAVAAIAAGDYDSAETLLQRTSDTALAAARRMQEAANKYLLVAAKAKADLGELKLTQLQLAAAVDRFREAADLVPASEALVRAEYLNRLGNTARDAANFSLADRALSEALRIREDKLDPENPDVAGSLNDLATLLYDTNRLGEAEPLLRRALAIGEKSYGPDHPNVAIGLNNLGLLLKDTNRLGEAELLYKRALAINEKSYGQDHSTVTVPLTNLARLLQDTNRLNEAEPLLRRALAIDEKSYGPDHPIVAVNLNNLAGLLYRTNRLGEAELLYKRALAVNEKSYGADHPRTRVTRINLQLLQLAIGASAGGARSTTPKPPRAGRKSSR